jgi:hypothetical protein
MSDRNNPKTLADLRDKIAAKAAETTLADSQFDYGHVDGWLGALYWADLIDLEALDELRSQAKVVFEQAVLRLNAR